MRHHPHARARCLLAFALLTTACGRSSVDLRGALEVQVLGPQGEPIANADVQLWDPGDETLIESDRTGAEGRTRLRHPGPGHYRIEARTELVFGGCAVSGVLETPLQEPIEDELVVVDTMLFACS